MSNVDKLDWNILSSSEESASISYFFPFIN